VSRGIVKGIAQAATVSPVGRRRESRERREEVGWIRRYGFRADFLKDEGRKCKMTTTYVASPFYCYR
jgi:hypothetical protein